MKFSINAGEHVVRTHFEKVVGSSIADESNAAPPTPLSHFSDPGNRKRKRADESHAAPPALFSHLSHPGNSVGSPHPPKTSNRKLR
eukprot:12094257-Karenia_brevis.AAC.1